MENNHENKTHHDRSFLEQLAIDATHQIGSLTSLIIHSIFFVGIFSLQWFGYNFDQIMLLLTTVVSLEAIYLAIFIQMTVNRQSHKLTKVSKEMEDISEDVEEISKDIDEISEDVEDIEEGIGKGDEKLILKHQYSQERIHHIELILKELLSEVRELKDKHK
ncbi:MAG: DUF1003 domain-containing protein [bacterium]|nr:DUF1003 domain-containing protein [bacterium]